MEEFKLYSGAYDALSIKFDQQRLQIKHRTYVLPIVMLDLSLEQISHIRLRKRFIWFGKQGFEINYRKHPKAALQSFFFVSKQPQAWLDTFTTAGINVILDE